MATAAGSNVVLGRNTPRYPLTADERYVAEAEYLESAYHPDMDYVDGHLEERNLGEYEHGELQGEILTVFRIHSMKWRIRAVPECRLQVSADRYRIPDILVLSRDEPKPEKIVSRPPLLCIEILSPRDSFIRMQARVDDYVRMGVGHVWLIDPCDLNRALVIESGIQRWNDSHILTVESTEISIDLKEIAEHLTTN